MAGDLGTLHTANVQKATGNGHCSYDLACNKVNAIHIVYKIRKYNSTGTEHNYLFSCGMDYNHRGICFLKEEKTMRVYRVLKEQKTIRVYGVLRDRKSTSYYNQCQKDRWNVVCVV